MSEQRTVIIVPADDADAESGYFKNFCLVVNHILKEAGVSCRVVSVTARVGK
jgi:hypothetical protein